jgi:hypothetical protein
MKYFRDLTWGEGEKLVFVIKETRIIIFPTEIVYDIRKILLTRKWWSSLL